MSMEERGGPGVGGVGGMEQQEQQKQQQEYTQQEAADHAMAVELQASLNASTRGPGGRGGRIRLKVRGGDGGGGDDDHHVGEWDDAEEKNDEQGGYVGGHDAGQGHPHHQHHPHMGGGGLELQGDVNRGNHLAQHHGENDDQDDEFMNTDDEEEAQRRAEEAKRLRNTAACMLTDDVLNGMGEEVEMVITHRVESGAVDEDRVREYTKVPLAGKGAWKHWVFYVKWARYSHVHNSWEGYEVLRGFGGFKKVMNYCKRVDEMQARKMEMTVEEREEVDWRENMEEELLKEHQEVERVFGERLDPDIGDGEVGGDGGDGGDGEERLGQSSHPQQQHAHHAHHQHHHHHHHHHHGEQFLVKWRGLPYSDASWETKVDLLETKFHWEEDGEGRGDAYREKNARLIEEYRRREARAMMPRQTVDEARRAFASGGFGPMKEQPGYLKLGKLRDYQLEGLNWMVYNWARGVNGILADEMGLGKTIQCASLVGYLSEMQNLGQPALVVVPLSTVPNWAKEFAKWIPDVNALVYVGNSSSREVIRHYEFPNRSPVPGRQRKFDALITTYEMVLKDAETLSKIKWSALLVDEAHRLKNTEAALYKELSQWKFKYKLLVTGTPLQNNIKELWALLHFLHPEKFPSCEVFERTYDLQDPSGVERLHNALRPHLLRRVIKDVEKSLPPKRERILRVPMTPLQKQYYKWILTRNFSQLNKNSKGSQIKLLNIIVDLKKCCNHPFLFDSAREEYQATTGVSEDIISNLVVTSGKMVLLDKLLGRLKETGHRVLIFSQMVRVLDIISEYMNRKGYRHQRLDGSTPSQKRHQAMDRFNAPDSPDFAFLLSTRAGGLGINLATADTVLLFDSDWNPQNDLQAMARAHRIGQKDSVNIYRFVTGSSVEEDILERAKSKMVLDHLVIQKMDTSGRTVLGKNSDNSSAAVGAKLFNKDELAAILKFGAEDLFKDDKEGGEDGSSKNDGTTMTDEDLDAILARAEEIEHKTEGGGSDDLLSSFKVATFKQDEDDAAFWDRLIPEHERPDERQQALAQQGLGGIGDDFEPGIRQARLKAMDYAPVEEPLPPLTAPKVSKKRAYKELPGAAIKGAELRIDTWPQAVDQEGRLLADESASRPEGFPRLLSKRDALAFTKAFKKFPHEFKLQEIADIVGGQLTGVGMDALRALRFGLLRGCEKAVESFEAKKGANNVGVSGGDGSYAGDGDEEDGDGVEAHKKALERDHSSAKDEPTHSIALATTGASMATNDTTTQAQQSEADQQSKPKAKPGSRARPPEAHLDFFGVDVRANEFLSLARQLKILDEKILEKAVEQGLSPEEDPSARYKVPPFVLSASELPSITGWTKTCDWTASDDSALLIGIYRHGIGEWEKIYNDESIDLSTKIAPAVRPETLPPGAMPRASHLETRSLGILRQLEKSKLHPSLKRKRQESRKEKSQKATVEKFASQLGDAPNMAVRKLRTLQRRGRQMDASTVLRKTEKYIEIIGKKIDEEANTAKQKLKLWNHVWSQSGLAMDGFALHQMYLRIVDEKKANAEMNL